MGVDLPFFIAAALSSSSAVESLGILPWRLQAVLRNERAAALQLEAARLAPNARFLLAAGGEQDVPRCVQWVDACPAKLGFGRCM